MLAKLIAHAEDRDACIDRMCAALAETTVLGVATNLGFLRWALSRPAFRAGEAGTDFVEREWNAGLVPDAAGGGTAGGARAHARVERPLVRVRAARSRRCGRPAGLVLHDGWHFAVGAADEPPSAGALGPGGSLAAPMPGTVLRVDVARGRARGRRARRWCVLEAMKMELAVTAPAVGVVSAVLVEAGELVSRGQALVELDGNG